MLDNLRELGKLLGGEGLLGIIIEAVFIGLFVYLFRTYHDFLDKKRMKENEQRERMIKKMKEYRAGIAERENEVKRLLKTEKKGDYKTGTEDLKKCPQCGLINPSSAMECDCGYSFDVEATGSRELLAPTSR